jgi:hypothetical protein
VRRGLALLFVLAALVPARNAHASIEQFSTFDVLAPEVDDEYAIDQVLLRPPEAWRAEWDTSATAVRADQGCLTAGIWYQDNQVKGRAPMGSRSWLDLGFTQHTDPAGSYEWLQFDFMRATRRYGAFGLRFRPSGDKSTQDFALLWTAGNGSSPLQAHVNFSIEDTFNKLWTFRQTQVGETHLQPYRVHPFEPSGELIWRGAHHRLEIRDQWLSPMRQDILDPDPALNATRTLFGHHGEIRGERSFGAWTPFARFETVNARSTLTTHGVPGDGRTDRQQWSAELGGRRAFDERWSAEGRYVYMTRAEDWRPPVADARFHALDRIAEATVAWQAHPHWRFDAGLLYDRVSIARQGVVPGFTYGTRKESRGLIGVDAQLGKVRFMATECIELDSEPYQVTFHHDKGFLHLQTSF